jgi:hypothetical protein
MFCDGDPLKRFQPSTPDSRAPQLIASSRKALDALEAIAKAESGLPSWVETRLQRGLIELRLAAAYAEARRKAFTPSDS